MMCGHFYTYRGRTSEEKLFIARCEALVSETTNKSTASIISTVNTTQDHTTSMLKITLKQDMTIDFASAK